MKNPKKVIALYTPEVYTSFVCEGDWKIENWMGGNERCWDVKISHYDEFCQGSYGWLNIPCVLHWQLFERDVEHAFCNPCNPQVLRLQLPCAARELPLKGICVKLVAKSYDVCNVKWICWSLLRIYNWCWQTLRPCSGLFLRMMLWLLDKFVILQLTMETTLGRLSWSQGMIS